MTGLTLDAGALIAIDRGQKRVAMIIGAAQRRGLEVHVVAGVVAQAWRGGPRQARLARFLDADGVTEVALDPDTARTVGVMCGRTSRADIVDVHVALHARMSGHAVVTSDPADLRAVDASLPLIIV